MTPPMQRYKQHGGCKFDLPQEIYMAIFSNKSLATERMQCEEDVFNWRVYVHWDFEKKVIVNHHVKKSNIHS